MDAGFCETQAARQVMRRFGAEGFVAYVRLLCMMLREDGGALRVGLGQDWEDIADQLGMGVDECRELVAVLAHYGAVVEASGMLTAPVVADGVEARRKKVEAGRRGGRPAGKTKSSAESGA